MSQSSQLVCTQEVGDISGWDEDVEMEPAGCWASLISTRCASDRFYCVDECEHFIGRDSNCEFTIPLHYVSSKHCSIIKDGGVIFVKDLSTNGTYLARGNRIKKIGRGKKMLVKNGDKIILIQKNEKLSINEISFTFIKEVEDNGINDYVIGKKIGSGAFATVYSGTHRDTLKPVAIKIIQKKKVSDRESILSEVKVLQQINHSGVVGIEDVYETDDEFYLVLELVSGGELFDLLQDKGFLSESEARPLMNQILGVLEYLHDKGIVHRDLKLENILLKDKNYKQIKISDFGLSKILGEGVFMQTMCGTPEYLAPEILDPALRSKSGYGYQVDLWSTGVIMFTLLCGFSPFSSNENSVFQNVAKGTFCFPSDVSLSYEAKDLITRLLRKDPDRRITASKALLHPWIKNRKIKKK